MNKDINCFFEEYINTCPHYDCINHECNDNVRECGMFDKYYMNPRSKYVRKPRWYENIIRQVVLLAENTLFLV